MKLLDVGVFYRENHRKDDLVRPKNLEQQLQYVENRLAELEEEEHKEPIPASLHHQGLIGIL